MDVKTQDLSRYTPEEQCLIKEFMLGNVNNLNNNFLIKKLEVANIARTALEKDSMSIIAKLFWFMFTRRYNDVLTFSAEEIDREINKIAQNFSKEDSLFIYAYLIAKINRFANKETLIELLKKMNSVILIDDFKSLFKNTFRMIAFATYYSDICIGDNTTKNTTDALNEALLNFLLVVKNNFGSTYRYLLSTEPYANLIFFYPLNTSVYTQSLLEVYDQRPADKIVLDDTNEDFMAIKKDFINAIIQNRNNTFEKYCQNHLFSQRNIDCYRAYKMLWSLIKEEYRPKRMILSYMKFYIKYLFGAK